MKEGKGKSMELLIGKLKARKIIHIKDRLCDGWNDAMDDAIAIIRQHEAELAMHAQSYSDLANGARSEIPVNDEAIRAVIRDSIFGSMTVCRRDAITDDVFKAIRPYLRITEPVSGHRMPDGRPIFGEDSPHNIGEHLESLAKDQPVGLTDQQICDIIAIFSNPESPKIKCEECNGSGHIDVEDEDGYKGRCEECDGYGYYHMAVNQTERIRQVREHVLNGDSPMRESGALTVKDKEDALAFMELGLVDHQSISYGADELAEKALTALLDHFEIQRHSHDD